MSHIAFIGLGNMGGPMAVNLLKTNNTVTVFDLSAESIERAVSQGCIASVSAESAVQDADIVITMLPAGAHVRSLLVTDNALLKAAKPNTLFIDCSTIDAETTKELAVAAEECGVDFIDAPVSGGTPGAVAGTLSFLVGGSEENFKCAQPVLDAMGANIFHAGDIGSGQIAKACNNMLAAILMTGTAEVLALGVKNGLSAEVLSNIMKKSSGGNWALEKYNPYPGIHAHSPASHNYEGGFKVDLMCKDLDLAMNISQNSKSPIPLGSAAKGLYNLHQNHGNGGLDFASIMQLYETPKTID